MRRLGGDVWFLVGLLLVFATLTVVISANLPEPPETTPRRSSYSAKPGGFKAAYRLLQETQVPVGQITVPPKKWPRDASVVITATPFTGNTWSKEEVTAVNRWVERGGTLILMDEETDDLLRNFGLDVNTYLTADASLPPRQLATFLDGIRHVRFPNRERILKSTDAAIPLFADKKTAMVALSRGRGVVYAMASPAILENRTLTQDDNARFFWQLVQSARRNTGKVYFNEYHQGYMYEDSLWTIIGKPGQFVFYQLLLVVILLSYSAGRRFGLPRPLPPASRVSSEYVTSLADLYRRARASDAALEGVYLAFWRDLCRATGMPLDSSTTEVARRAAGLGEVDQHALEQRLTRLLGECEDKIAAGPKVITDVVLLRLTNEMEDLRKELQLGGHD